MQLTSKGQVTVPKKFRDKYGLHQGVDVEFKDENGGLHLVKSTSRKNAFDKIYGLLKTPHSTDEIMNEIRR